MNGIFSIAPNKISGPIVYSRNFALELARVYEHQTGCVAPWREDFERNGLAGYLAQLGDA